MTLDAGNTAHDAARVMLEAFASVGADAFDLTITNRQGTKVQFRRAVTVGHLRRDVGAQLDAAARLERNVIVRPHGPVVVFIQLDDLTRAGVERLRPVAFLGLETSPGNYQAWLAMRRTLSASGKRGSFSRAFFATPCKTDDDFARRLRQGIGADPAASGATRVAGSLNFKNKYAPDFPRVKIAYASPGQTVSKEKLAQLGLLADVPQRAAARTTKSSGYGNVRRWPNYERCVAGAPRRRDETRPDISRADFTWCMIAIDWGWSIEETAARLMAESVKARENGEHYALRTAQRAAVAIKND